MISAKVIAKSVSPLGDRLMTVELEYPRFVHAELMTHRQFSRNAMSSRAVPIEKMISIVEDSPAMPVEWGINQSGMQAKEVFTKDYDIATCEYLWLQAAKSAVEHAKQLQAKGLHKQIVNRVLEPFQMIRVVVSSTEWDNFYYLRCHEDAQPEIKVVAEKILTADRLFEAQSLSSNEWHTPYMNAYNGHSVWYKGLVDYEGKAIDKLTALMISSSCCAQVSFRQLDESPEKAKRIYDRLVDSKPVHASPFEHQAKPMMTPSVFVNNPADPNTWEEGVTHVDKHGQLWSGNFKGWIQHRQLIDGHVFDDHYPK